MPLVFVLPVALADTPKRAESMVVGGSVVWALGPVEHGRLGLGVDLGHQFQRFLERAETIDGRFTVWAEERWAPNYGPVGHVWWCDGAWFVGAGVRAGVAWPLRMGLVGGWWPGPAVAGEVGGVMSTSGLVGLDLQAGLDAPWVQGRLGVAVHPKGWGAARVSAGPFLVLQAPGGWPDTRGDVWDPERTP